MLQQRAERFGPAAETGLVDTQPEPDRPPAWGVTEDAGMEDTEGAPGLCCPLSRQACRRVNHHLTGS